MTPEDVERLLDDGQIPKDLPCQVELVHGKLIWVPLASHFHSAVVMAVL